MRDSSTDGQKPQILRFIILSGCINISLLNDGNALAATYKEFVESQDLSAMVTTFKSTHGIPLLLSLGFLELCLICGESFLVHILPHEC